jgi:hypothetical protein
MTPKEKAFDLILKFQHPLSEESDTDCLHIKVAKEFALIAVDEILLFIEDDREGFNWKDYYKQVKQEIEAL